jgi:phage virion morphogenesis protein
MIRIALHDDDVFSRLTRLAARLDDMTPVLADIGEHLTETSKRRFDASIAPDGKRWAPNSETTILQYLGRYKGSHKKGGSISSSGAARAIGKKPLIGETRSLGSTIFYQLVGNNAVEIGSPMEYAGMMHFGGSKSEFPHLWGDIPGRPFLGLSTDDEASILDIIDGYLSQS